MKFRKLIVYNRIYANWYGLVNLYNVYIRNIKVNYHGDGAIRRNHVEFHHPVYWTIIGQHYQVYFCLNGSVIHYD